MCAPDMASEDDSEEEEDGQSSHVALLNRPVVGNHRLFAVEDSSLVRVGQLSLVLSITERV